MIVLYLRGRIGNQLFMFAMAESVRHKRGGDESIVIYDREVRLCKWENSLCHYNLSNVRYVHSKWRLPFRVLLNVMKIDRLYRKLDKLSFVQKSEIELKLQDSFLKDGIMSYENGYLEIPVPQNKDILVFGYFQSEQYFKDYSKLIKEEFHVHFPHNNRYIELAERLKKSNSVCISIKVEHNIGSKLYDVCSLDYYREAISIIMNRVSNPLFFICSDNVQYVMDHLIDTNNVEYLCQDREMGVHESLQMMSYCKHFILSNTSYGWWAQYLSSNPNKIVIAPNRWMRVDMPIDIYDNSWTLVDVSDYVDDKKIKGL